MSKGQAALVLVATAVFLYVVYWYVKTQNELEAAVINNPLPTDRTFIRDTRIYARA